MTPSPYLAATLRNIEAGYDFTERQKAVLGLIVESDAGECGCSYLVNTLATSRPNITRAVDILAIHGYVTRRHPAADRRLVIVRATAQGSDAWCAMAGLPRRGRRTA